jgi:hypothetical protein
VIEKWENSTTRKRKKKKKFIYWKIFCEENNGKKREIKNQLC